MQNEKTLIFVITCNGIVHSPDHKYYQSQSFSKTTTLLLCTEVVLLPLSSK